jgi:hypothetical protein
MSTPAHLQPYILGAVAVLVAWRVYRRVRRLVGRQKFSAFRSWLSAVLFPVLICLLAVGAFEHLLPALSESCGVALGVGLGLYGLRLTRYEDTPEGRFYTPSAHIGIALSLLFVARVAYKLIHAYTATASFTQPPADMVRSPLTLFMVGTLAGYYATYAVGLLWWNHRVKAQAELKGPARGA